jgi:hypothetical protein
MLLVNSARPVARKEAIRRKMQPQAIFYEKISVLPGIYRWRGEPPP